jgi:uncharacterized protein (TIGR02145 family)
MRSLQLFCLFLFLLISCKKDGNDNGGDPTSVPVPPKDLTAALVSITQIDLTWTDNSNNEDGFKIQRKTGSGNFADIGSVGRDVTKYSDKNLILNTTYTYRVYSYNQLGFADSYTNEVTVTVVGPTSHSCGSKDVHNAAKIYGTITDIDGNAYKTIQIGDQVWMAENLKTTKYRNGINIPNISDNSEWRDNTTGAYCSYENNASNECPYGKLYNWYVIKDNTLLCPTGWHVPSDEEWTTLINFLGGAIVAGGQMKSEGIQFWLSPNLEGINSTGFSGLPGGIRYDDGTFFATGKDAYWWSSTETGTDGAWDRSLFYASKDITRVNNPKKNGASIRCIKD